MAGPELHGKIYPRLTRADAGFAFRMYRNGCLPLAVKTKSKITREAASDLAVDERRLTSSAVFTLDKTTGFFCPRPPHRQAA
jgi:hypothetical protein